MKKNHIVISIIILIIVGLIGSIGLKYYKSHNNNTPESAFNSFIYALNKDDINGMLLYLEPTEAEIASEALCKLDEITDSKIVSTLVRWLPFLSNFTDTQFLPKLEPNIISITESNNKATITISLENSENLYDVYMAKIDKKWYVQFAWKSDNNIN